MALPKSTKSVLNNLQIDPQFLSFRMQDEDDLEEAPPFEPLYDLTEKVREANLALGEQEAPSEERPRPVRVKFNEEITEFEFWESEDDWSGEGLLASTKEEDVGVLLSDDEVELLPLEEEVRLGFPHGAELQDAYENDEDPVRVRVGPSSVEEEDPPVSTISEELNLSLDLRNCIDDDDEDLQDARVERQKVARSTQGGGRSREQVAGKKQRPWTAPSGGGAGSEGLAHKEACSGRWSCSHLPHYNGLRSEYGLSKEQLEERKRIQRELAEEKRARAHQKQQETEERKDENERVFRAWLARKQGEKYFYGHKRKDTEEQRLQKVLVEARRREAEESYKEWLRKKKQEKRVRSNKRNKWNSKDFESIFGCMDHHTQRTFRIYLGFSN